MTQASTDIPKCFDDQRLLPVTGFLRDYKIRADQRLYAECYKRLSDLKQEAVQQGDQRAAKAIWCLETIAKVQEHYLNAFQCMRSGQFKEGWDQLARCEAEATFLKQHFADDNMEFGVAYICTHTKRFQDLFPVKWGISPEILRKETRCSICDTILSLRTGCDHLQGEIYDGEMCYAVASKWELLAVSLVENPVQKSTMIFPEGDQLEQLNPIRSIAESLGSPWQPWAYHKEERRRYHPAFKGLGRNEKCPCGSDQKYKRCCLNKEIVFPHLQAYMLDEP